MMCQAAPPTGTYRVTDPNGLTISGFPYEMGDILPRECPLRDMPERLALLVHQRKLEQI